MSGTWGGCYIPPQGLQQVLTLLYDGWGYTRAVRLPPPAGGQQPVCHTPWRCSEEAISPPSSSPCQYIGRPPPNTNGPVTVRLQRTPSAKPPGVEERKDMDVKQSRRDMVQVKICCGEIGEEYERWSSVGHHIQAIGGHWRACKHRYEQSSERLPQHNYIPKPMRDPCHITIIRILRTSSADRKLIRSTGGNTNKVPNTLSQVSKQTHQRTQTIVRRRRRS